MNSMTELDRVFPLSAGSSERPVLHAPRLRATLAVTPGAMMGHSSFLRAWAARRAKAAEMGASSESGIENLRAVAVSLR